MKHLSWVIFVIVALITAPSIARADTDPVASAAAAWHSRNLLSHALAVDLNVSKLSPEWQERVAKLEIQWDAFRANQNFQETDRDVRLARLVSYCPAARTHPVCAALARDLETASHQDMITLENAVTLIEFLKFSGVQSETGVVLSEFFTRQKYNCASASLVALHLMQRAGEESFAAFQMPDHVNLSLTLASGKIVFLNNAREFLPWDYFQNPPASTAYTKLADEKPAAPWAVVASVYINSGKRLFFARKGDAALAAWQQALSLDPMSTTTINNIGAAFSAVKNWRAAADHYRKALAINPHYARAQANLESTLRVATN